MPESFDHASGDTSPVFSQPAPGVGLIELNRPAVANRIEDPDLDALMEKLMLCEEDSDTRVLILAARGRHFSSGFDLRALASQVASDQSGADRGEERFEQFANRLERTRLVTVAAVQGPVIGGATDLVLACDFRLGTHHATMHMPAARFGLPLYSGALQRYVSRLGVNAAKCLVLGAATLHAAQMKDIGFLTALVDPTELHDECLRLASRIACMPAEPLSAMKRVLNEASVGRGNSEQCREWLRSAFDGQSIIERVAQVRASRLLQRKAAE